MGENWRNWPKTGEIGWKQEKEEWGSDKGGCLPSGRFHLLPSSLLTAKSDQALQGEENEENSRATKRQRIGGKVGKALQCAKWVSGLGDARWRDSWWMEWRDWDNAEETLGNWATETMPPNFQAFLLPWFHFRSNINDTFFQTNFYCLNLIFWTVLNGCSVARFGPTHYQFWKVIIECIVGMDVS